MLDVRLPAIIPQPLALVPEIVGYAHSDIAIIKVNQCDDSGFHCQLMETLTLSVSRLKIHNLQVS